MERRRVVVTALGVVSAAGVGVDTFWKGLDERPGPGPHAIVGWDPDPWIPRKESRRLDRFSQFGLVAAHEALGRANGLSSYDPDRVAVAIGTGVGGLTAMEELVKGSYEPEPRVSPVSVPMMMSNAAAAAVSIAYGFGGSATAPVTACAAGSQAIVDAARQIEWGYADAAVAGGAEAAIRTPTIEGFRAARALSPTLTARPFDRGRDGFVLGEGAAILVLEERQAALHRGAEILAELAGAASTSDAYHITAPHPEGTGAERAVRLALADAGVDPDAVGYVNAHGTGTDLNDRTEGGVIARVFGDSQPAVSSIKGATGHALGASGAIEAVATVLAVHRGELPPNIGLDSQDPDIPLTDVVRERRSWTPTAAASNSFGFGGHNTVLVFTPA